MLDTSLYNTEEILQLLNLEQIGEDRYRGQSHFMGSPNVFGGQVVGQALHAATATVDGRRPHSLHSLFILAGNHRLPIEYEVERVRDGGTFTTRRVVAYQEGKRIFVTSISFQVPEEGLSHQKSMPEAPLPDSLPSTIRTWKDNAASVKRPFQPVPVDFRVANGGDMYGTNDGMPFRQVWTRAPIALPDDVQAHETLFGYVSDYGLLWTSLQPHGVRMGDTRLQIASLDHSIWFHRPFRMDEWLLFAMESPNASGGRGLCFAHVYNQEGLLVATLAQEGLIRLREKKNPA
jgi:acyl-CoA thioesterase II